MKNSQALLIFMVFNCSAQYRNDMPEVIQQQPNINQNTLQSHGNLHNSYASVGSPKILLLIGRKLGSDSSEWQSDSRETISTMNRAYQGNNSSKDTRDTYRMTEKRKVIQVNASSGTLALYQGFNAFMQAQNLPAVSYDSILRQAQRNNELSGNIDRSTDKREIEADAILANVDILIEIINAGSITVLGKRVDKVQVSVTRMDTFETVSQHIGQGPEYYSIKDEWITDNSGYRKIQSVYLHHENVGYQVAGELLSKAFMQPYLKRPSANNNINGMQNNAKPKVKKKKRVLPPKT